MKKTDGVGWDGEDLRGGGCKESTDRKWSLRVES